MYPSSDDGGKGRLYVIAAILIIAALIIVAVAVSNQSVQNAMPICTASTQSSSDVSPVVQTNPKAYYDEQQWFGFQQNYTSLEYNVTARAFNDSFGFGPGFILSGLSDKGLWYQVGVAYDWINRDWTPSDDGFQMFYQVWNNQTNISIFPSGGSEGLAALNGIISSGDKFLLSLSYLADGNVSMSVKDWKSGVSLSKQYLANGASQFVSRKNVFGSHPSSLLMEWYHALPYDCNRTSAVFSIAGSGITSGWLSTDEWNFTCVTLANPCTPFNASDPRENNILSPSPSLVDFAASGSFQKFLNPTLGSLIYANRTEFITM